MNTKTIIAGLIGGIASFFLGWLFYGMLFKETLAGFAGSATGVWRADNEMIFWALILGNLILGLLIAYIFSGWAGITTFAGGAQAGAIIGFLFTFGSNMIGYSVTNIMHLNGSLLDVGISTFMWAICGGLVGWWLGRTN